MPAKKRAIKTRHDWAKEKESAKAMIYRGESAADAARALGIKEATVRSWIFEGEWKAQIKEVEQLVKQQQQTPSIPQRLAFDFAQTKKDTRSAYARASLKAAEFIESQPPEKIFASGKNFAAHVASAERIAGDWEKDKGPQFAVALNINTLPQGQVIDVE